MQSYNTAHIRDRGDEFVVTVKDSDGKFSQTAFADFNSATAFVCQLPLDYVVTDWSTGNTSAGYSVEVWRLRELYPELC